MNPQLNQLMLNEELPEADSVVTARAEIDRMKQRLRTIAELERTPGYKLLMEAINVEAKQCLHLMDKADTSHKATQYGANYFTLTQIAGWAANEQAKLMAMLKSVNAL